MEGVRCQMSLPIIWRSCRFFGNHICEDWQFGYWRKGRHLFIRQMDKYGLKKFRNATAGQTKTLIAITRRSKAFNPNAKWDHVPPPPLLLFLFHPQSAVFLVIRSTANRWQQERSFKMRLLKITGNQLHKVFTRISLVNAGRNRSKLELISYLYELNPSNRSNSRHSVVAFSSKIWNSCYELKRDGTNCVECWWFHRQLEWFFIWRWYHYGTWLMHSINSTWGNGNWNWN